MAKIFNALDYDSMPYSRVLTGSIEIDNHQMQAFFVDVTTFEIPAFNEKSILIFKI